MLPLVLLHGNICAATEIAISTSRAAGAAVADQQNLQRFHVVALAALAQLSQFHFFRLLLWNLYAVIQRHTIAQNPRIIAWIFLLAHVAAVGHNTRCGVGVALDCGNSRVRDADHNTGMRMHILLAGEDNLRTDLRRFRPPPRSLVIIRNMLAVVALALHRIA